VLAKELGVSRGSFYWHFQHVEAFHLAVMQRWQNLATDAIIRQVESAAIGSERLRLLIRLAFTSDSGLEAGMRTWAIYYEPAMACVEKVDASRLGYLEQLLANANLAKSRARTRSRIIYWTYLGSVLSGQNVSEEEFENLVGELIAYAQKPS
jgi:AcrR family transcriptional regulator